MLLKYSDYISESVVFKLLLESEVVFSKKFTNILSAMKDSEVAKNILSLNAKDIDVANNYIDMTDIKDTVSFTPDRKAQELKSKKTDIYIVTDSNKYLTYSDSNNRVFERLEFDKTTQTAWIPSSEQRGKILRETHGSNNKTYCLFQEEDGSDRLAVINKVGLAEEGNNTSEIWKTSRNNIKIGRLVRSLLKSADISFLDKDIEDFVNNYKATYDLILDGLKGFDIVTGGQIAYWYPEHKYVSGGGTLNSSCMREVDSDYFEIYCTNKNISMVILYSDEESDKIKGRAILWEGKTKSGSDIKFLDRIYTVQDSDVKLFKEFAQKNGWWYKYNQNMSPDEQITNGTEYKMETIIVSLEYPDCEQYPYMDTMCFIDTYNNICSNDLEYIGEYDEDSEEYNNEDNVRVAKDTEGETLSIYDYKN